VTSRNPSAANTATSAATAVPVARSAATKTSPASSSGPRRGLVLGAGGVLGAAWMIGALRVFEEQTGIDPRTVETVVGTSAGSVLAASLASGVGTEELALHQQQHRGAADLLAEAQGTEPDEGPASRFQYDYDSQRSLPPRPRWGTVGSVRLLTATARRPRRVTPLAAMTALLPAGRGSIEEVGRLIDQVAPADGSWPSDPHPWIVAMDYATGRRIPFGRAGSPPASLRQAVQASCAIPGWYEPVSIGGHRYVDGGTCSSTSLDLLAGLGLDEVFVFAPMASFVVDSPKTALARIERGIRHTLTRRLRREAVKVKAAATRVAMLGPGPADLEAIGVNLMNPRRRQRVFETAMTSTPVALEDALRRGRVTIAA